MSETKDSIVARITALLQIDQEAANGSTRKFAHLTDEEIKSLKIRDIVGNIKKAALPDITFREGELNSGMRTLLVNMRARQQNEQGKSDEAPSLVTAANINEMLITLLGCSNYKGKEMDMDEDGKTPSPDVLDWNKVQTYIEERCPAYIWRLAVKSGNEAQRGQG